MKRKIWLGGVAAALLAAGFCLFMPRLSGLAMILLALAAVAAVAYRLL